MRLASTLIPPSLDPKQALRLRRFGVAALSYVLATALLAVGWAVGKVAAATALEAAAAFIAVNLGLYAMIRSGLNLRFADPSLTRLQILAAISVLMYVVYHMDDGRHIALFGCFIVFLFGVVRLGVRELVMVTLYTLAAYALVINLLMHWRPQAIQDVPREWLSWLGLAGFLPCYVIIGGQINALRRRMRESEARFRGLTEMSSDFYWETDAGHRVSGRGSADRKIGAASLFRKGAQIGQRRWEVPYLTPDEAGWRAHRADLDAHRAFRAFEFSRLALDGSERIISLSGDPVFDAPGEFRGYRGVGSDITERRKSERALRESAEQLRLFADNVPAMTVYWDANLRIRFASRVFTEFYGLDIADILGKDLRELFGEAVYREITEYVDRAMRGHEVTYQATRRRKDGEFRNFESRLHPYLAADGKVLGCFGLTIDITAHKEAEARIQRAAHHDALTGLPNRSLFDDRLDQAIGLAKRDDRQFAVLFLDLDRFKPVNDTLGHAAGDELLRAVASRIRHQVRDSDTVARIGGDEFAIILPDIGGRPQADRVSAKIIAAVAAPFELGGARQRVEVGTSIGIAIYPSDAADAAGLVRAADAAMYQAKLLERAIPAGAA